MVENSIFEGTGTVGTIDFERSVRRHVPVTLGLLVLQQSGRISAGPLLLERLDFTLQYFNRLTDNLTCPAELTLHAAALLRCSWSPPGPRLPLPAVRPLLLRELRLPSRLPLCFSLASVLLEPLASLELFQGELQPLFRLLRRRLSPGRPSVSMSDLLELFDKGVQDFLRFHMALPRLRRSFQAPSPPLSLAW